MSSDHLGLIDDDPITPVTEELLLTDKDFPAFYINKHHPDDYKISNTPIEKELIFHEYKGGHNRLLLRCSIKLSDDLFCPMTFVLDTGAPKVYMSAIGKSILAEYKLLINEEDLGIDYVKFLGRKYIVEDTPEGHAPANILGLKTLCRWGLTMHDEPSFGFTLENDFSYLEA